jgi:hypothetical protein
MKIGKKIDHGVTRSYTQSFTELLFVIFIFELHVLRVILQIIPPCNSVSSVVNKKNMFLVNDMLVKR